MGLSPIQKVHYSVLEIIEFIGDDPNREGLEETPKRVIESWSELFSGYGSCVEAIFKTFDDGACDEMVLLKNIEFYSTCEHHMLPFMGMSHIAYIPNGKVIGISKLARLLEIFARRLQIQERIGMQVTEALQTHLRPKGAACVLQAKHLCMTCRGVNKQGSEMVTSSLTGVFRENTAARAELFSLIGKG
jgi:GTP cyclohydrolase IA